MFYFASVLIGLACSALAGYVSARIAKHHERLNGLLASVPCGLLAVYELAIGKNTDPAPITVLLLLMASASALLGGHLRVLQVRSNAQMQAHLASLLEGLETSVAIKMKSAEVQKKITRTQILFMPGSVMAGLGLFGIFSDTNVESFLSPFRNPAVAWTALGVGVVLSIIEYQKLKLPLAFYKELRKLQAKDSLP